MRFVTLHGKKSGRPIYVAADRVEAIAVTDEGSTEVCASCSVGLVAETPEEALRIVEDANPDACAALVDAAKRLIDWMDTISAPIADHNQAIKDIRAALDALRTREVPRG